MDDFAQSGSPTYSRSNFYIGATDKKGHNSRGYYKIDPTSKGEITAIIAAKVIPVYRSEYDFHRDAIHHRIHDLQEMLKDSAPTWSGRLSLLERRMTTESEIEYLQRLIDSDERLVKGAQGLMKHPPDIMTIPTIERAIGEISDMKLKERLKRDLEEYKSTYRF